jgi:hypothetical protein
MARRTRWTMHARIVRVITSLFPVPIWWRRGTYVRGMNNQGAAKPEYKVRALGNVGSQGVKYCDCTETRRDASEIDGMAAAGCPAWFGWCAVCIMPRVRGFHTPCIPYSHRQARALLTAKNRSVYRTAVSSEHACPYIPWSMLLRTTAMLARARDQNALVDWLHILTTLGTVRFLCWNKRKRKRKKKVRGKSHGRRYSTY